jgi:hypothetical protein
LGTGSDVSLTVAIWLGTVTFALILAVVAQFAMVRLLGAARRRRRQVFESIWLPILLSGMEREPESLPLVKRRDVASFLTIWNRLQDSIVGGFRERLNRIAISLGMDRVARQMLARGEVGQRLLAAATLGRLRDRAAWSDLLALSVDRDLVLSLSAARALLRIDSRAALERLLPLIAEREDWSPSAVVLMLLEAGADAISRPLAEAAVRAAPEQAHRLIRYFGLAHHEVVIPVVRELLVRRADHAECVTACLRVFRDTRDAAVVRRYLTDPQWEVRVRAIEVLGRIGIEDDRTHLTPLLSDSEWWVRYRAAQALCSLSSENLDCLAHMSVRHRDPFARDILTHALAERRYA